MVILLRSLRRRPVYMLVTFVFFQPAGTVFSVWALFRTIVAERQRREIEPTAHFLAELIQSDEFRQENEDVRRRIQDTHSFITTLTAWTQEMLRLSTETLTRVLKLGASIQKLLR